MRVVPQCSAGIVQGDTIKLKVRPRVGDERNVPLCGATAAVEKGGYDDNQQFSLQELGPDDMGGRAVPVLVQLKKTLFAVVLLLLQGEGAAEQLSGCDNNEVRNSIIGSRADCE